MGMGLGLAKRIWPSVSGPPTTKDTERSSHCQSQSLERCRKWQRAVLCQSGMVQNTTDDMELEHKHTLNEDTTSCWFAS